MEYEKYGKIYEKRECHSGGCGQCWTCNMGDPEVFYRNGHRYVEQHGASGEFICSICSMWECGEDGPCEGPYISPCKLGTLDNDNCEVYECTCGYHEKQGDPNV